MAVLVCVCVCVTLLRAFGNKIAQEILFRSKFSRLCHVVLINGNDRATDLNVYRNS